MTTTSKFKEIELKYSAEDLKLPQFEAFCMGRPNLQKKILASGYDHFYSHAQHPGAFCRHRVGPDMNQLTFKRKTSDANNFVRTEHNIDLERHITTDQIKALVNEFGYAYNTSIFKSCWVYKYDWHTLVFYVCYDQNMKELGRFLEIEAAEDYPWQNAEQAWADITALEKLFKPLNISAQKRLKLSLYEMFRKKEES